MAGNFLDILRALMDRKGRQPWRDPDDWGGGPGVPPAPGPGPTGPWGTQYMSEGSLAGQSGGRGVFKEDYGSLSDLLEYLQKTKPHLFNFGPDLWN